MVISSATGIRNPLKASLVLPPCSPFNPDLLKVAQDDEAQLQQRFGFQEALRQTRITKKLLLSSHLLSLWVKQRERERKGPPVGIVFSFHSILLQILDPWFYSIFMIYERPHVYLNFYRQMGSSCFLVIEKIQE